MWVDWAALLIAPTLTAEVLQARAYASQSFSPRQVAGQRAPFFRPPDECQLEAHA
jgi:hypothetical protein